MHKADRTKTKAVPGKETGAATQNKQVNSRAVQKAHHQSHDTGECMNIYIDQFRHAIEAAGLEAPAEIYADGKLRRFSTNGKRSDDSGWYVLHTNGIPAGSFGCWRQGITVGWKKTAGVYRSKVPSPKSQPGAIAKIEHDRQVRERINASTWNHAHPLQAQSPVGLYLRQRGLVLNGYPDALRMAALPYYDCGIETGRFPAMLGAVTDQHGRLLSLHRTFLSFDGYKAPVPQPKKLMGTSGPLTGVSIKLYPPQIINGKLTLGVAEGVETALACWLGAGIPTWSCISAGGMKSFAWPVGLESLVIFADHDAKGIGQAAARELAARAAAAGLEVRVLVPATVGADWLDVYCGGAL